MKIYNLECKLGNSKENLEMSIKETEKYYQEAITQAKKYLVEHELTSVCHKNFGYQCRKLSLYEKASDQYKIARDMQERLYLNTSEEYVLLLNGIGSCLLDLKRSTDARDVFEEALDIAESSSKTNSQGLVKGRHTPR